MEATPGPAFVVIQPQVGFVALEKRFDLKAGTTQAQATLWAGRLYQGGQVQVIGRVVAFGPVHHQPTRMPIPAVPIQVAVGMDRQPANPGSTFRAVSRRPRGRMPLVAVDRAAQRGEGEGRRRARRHIPGFPRPARFHRFGPSRQITAGVQEIFQVQLPQPATQFTRHPVDLIAQHGRATDPVRQDFPDQCERHHRLGLKLYFRRDSGGRRAASHPGHSSGANTTVRPLGPQCPRH